MSPQLEGNENTENIKTTACKVHSGSQIQNSMLSFLKSCQLLKSEDHTSGN